MESIHPILLYVDTGAESQTAIKLLAQLGIPMDVKFCLNGEEGTFPTAIYRASMYTGVDRIHILRWRIIDYVLPRPPCQVPSLVIRYDLLRGDKPLSEVTPSDVPPGLDADDVCPVDEHGELLTTRTALDAFRVRMARIGERPRV